jgi:hypothetical protein
VAAVTTTVATLATLAAVNPTVATGTTMAAVAGDGRRLSAREGDRDHREKHRNCNSKETLHLKPPGMELNAQTSRSRHLSTPTRDGHRIKATERSPDRSSNFRAETSEQPAALPCEGCGLAKICRLRNLGKEPTLRR